MKGLGEVNGKRMLRKGTSFLSKASVDINLDLSLSLGWFP